MQISYFVNNRSIGNSRLKMVASNLYLVQSPVYMRHFHMAILCGKYI